MKNLNFRVTQSYNEKLRKVQGYHIEKREKNKEKKMNNI